MNTAVSIFFYIQRSKINNQGICPIYARVKIQAKRFEFSANNYVNPDRRSSEGSKLKGSNEEARTINNHLDYLKNQVLEAEKRLVMKDIAVTSENLKNKLFGNTKNKRMLVPIFQDYNNKIKELIGKEYAFGTLERYKTS
jgi:Arm DNA-binding domain